MGGSPAPKESYIGKTVIETLKTSPFFLFLIVLFEKDFIYI
jgi:hypothetical protein